MGMKNYCYTPDYCGELNNSVERLTGEKSQLESENADLQAKLEGAEKELRFEEQTSAFWKGRSEKADTDRDNLQAQLLNIKNVMIEHCNHFNSRITAICKPPGNECIMYAICDGIYKALSTTPAEAGERVKGLMEAMQFYADAENYVKRVSEYAIEWIDPVVVEDSGKRAKEALQKYQGGAASS